MQENEKNADNLAAAQAPSYSQTKGDDGLVREIEKIRRRQKFLKILASVMGIIMLAGFLLVYWIYRKAQEYKPFLDSARQLAEQSSAFMEANKLQNLQGESIPASSSSEAQFKNSSLSMIGFGEAAADAAQDPQSREELKAVVQEYKETPEMKAMMEEFKKDPELKKIMESADPANPSEAMNKIKNPAVMKKVMDMMIKNPQFISAMMKMASDPRVSSAINAKKQGEVKQENTAVPVQEEKK